MSKQDIEKMKQLLAEKKTKGHYFTGETVIGSGSVEKRNKNIRTGWEGSKKISQ